MFPLREPCEDCSGILDTVSESISIQDGYIHREGIHQAMLTYTAPKTAKVSLLQSLLSSRCCRNEAKEWKTLELPDSSGEWFELTSSIWIGMVNPRRSLTLMHNMWPTGTLRSTPSRPLQPPAGPPPSSCPLPAVPATVLPLRWQSLAAREMMLCGVFFGLGGRGGRASSLFSELEIIVLSFLRFFLEIYSLQWKSGKFMITQKLRLLSSRLLVHFEQCRFIP